jgi:hypothetical protein
MVRACGAGSWAPTVGAYLAKAAFGAAAVTATELPQALRLEALDLLASLHLGNLDDATGVVLGHCPDLSAGPRLVDFAAAVAAQLAESFQAVEVAYAGQLGPGLEMHGGGALAAVPQLLSAVVEHDEAAEDEALQQLAGADVDVMAAVTAVIALGTATLCCVLAEAQAHGETLPQLLQRLRRRWT